MKADNLFLYELRKAHAILVAHKQGAVTTQALTRRTSTSISDVMFWCRVFGLELKNEASATPTEETAHEC